MSAIGDLDVLLTNHMKAVFNRREAYSGLNWTSEPMSLVPPKFEFTVSDSIHSGGAGYADMYQDDALVNHDVDVKVTDAMKDNVVKSFCAYSDKYYSSSLNSISFSSADQMLVLEYNGHEEYIDLVRLPTSMAVWIAIVKMFGKIRGISNKIEFRLVLGGYIARQAMPKTAISQNFDSYEVQFSEDGMKYPAIHELVRLLKDSFDGGEAALADASMAGFRIITAESTAPTLDIAVKPTTPFYQKFKALSVGLPEARYAFWSELEDEGGAVVVDHIHRN